MNPSPIERDDSHPYGVKLPPPGLWNDYPTVFKLPGPGEAVQDEVHCVKCEYWLPLADYLADVAEGELDPNSCPECKYTLKNKKR